MSMLLAFRATLQRKGSLPLVAVVLYILRHLWFRWRKLPSAPWLDDNRLLGSWPGIFRAAGKYQIHEWLLSLHKRFGKTFQPVVPFGLNFAAVVTADAKNVEHILSTNFENYPKGWALRMRFFDLLGNGIFNADGKDWHYQRKTTSHMFTAKLFKEHIWAVVQRNSRKVRNILESTAADTSIDIFSLMNRFTLDTIGEIGFGKVIGSLEDPSSPFLLSFDRAQQIVFMRFIIPWWPLTRLLGFGLEKETRKHLGLLDEYSRNVVRDLKAAMAQGDAKTSNVSWADIEARKSFVGLFVADAQKKGEEISEDYLRDLVLNFLIAGRDTTAQALSWTLYCLCTHPDVEEKARQEIISVCGDDGPTYENINQLAYLQAVLSETLRLYPSVPFDMKIAENDDTWPDGTFVPAGTEVAYNIFSMGRDTSIWGPDAEVFRPERWLEMSKMPSNFQYPVFNGGPRECLGRRLAQVEMKACLATLLPRVSLKLAVPADQITTGSQLTIAMGPCGLPCFATNHSWSKEKDKAMGRCSSECSSTAGDSEAGALTEEFDSSLD